MAVLETYVKVAGAWRSIEEQYVKVTGQWRAIDQQWVKVTGIWREVDQPQPPDPPSGGTFVLSPTSFSIPPINGQDSWAVFNTNQFRGDIATVKARITWGVLGSPSMNVYGRASGTYYRNIAQDTGWANRTIDHDISQGVSQFNAGSATGYTLRPVDTNVFPPTYVKRMRLVLVTT